MTLLDAYLKQIEPLKGSKNYHIWSFITTLSGLLERRVWLDRGRLGILFPNMYTILVGRAATGKSFSAEQATSLLRELVYPITSTPMRIGPTKITQAALYQELHDAERPLLIPGKEPLIQSPLFIYASELAINMVDFGGGTLTNELIDFYDSKSNKAIVEKRIVSGGLIRLHNPSITLLGCTTESFLQQAANANLITSGLASRIVFVVEPNRVEKQRQYIEMDRNLRQSIQFGMLNIFNMRGPMSLDKEAEQYYLEQAALADSACFDSVSEFLQNYYGRKPDHLCKVAMVFASMQNRYSIKKVDLEQAEILLHEIEPNMLKAFGMKSIDKDESAVAYILPLIPYEPDCITRTDLLSKLMGQGKFMPINGTYKALVDGLKFSGEVKLSISGTEEIYSRKRAPA